MAAELMTRADVDRRIRRVATIAAWFCSAVAAVGLLAVALNVYGAIALTCVGMAEDGSDVVTAFLLTEPERVLVDEPRYFVGRSWPGGAPQYQLASAVGGALSFAAYFVAKRMCQRVAATGEVFSVGRVRDLRRFARLLVIGSVVPGVMGIAGMALSMQLSWATLMSWQGPPAGFVLFDFGELALGVFLLLVARMFEYGCILQKQDDETL